ncbi:hypothetical protein FQZ97_1116610 [compost metagenome]
MVNKYASETAVTENSAAEFPDLRRGGQPAGSFGIKISQLLQANVLLFRKDLHAHFSGHGQGAVFRLVLFP